MRNCWGCTPGWDMKLRVTVTFRDDRKEDFDCVDYPAYGDFLILYLVDFTRVSLSKDGIAKIETKFI